MNRDFLNYQLETSVINNKTIKNVSDLANASYDLADLSVLISNLIRYHVIFLLN